MTDQTELELAIAGAEAYEALHVPALFGEWTSRVLDAADVAPGHRVLDVACGTGVLARDARSRVGAKGRVFAVDPNPGMLSVARRIDDAIDWRQGTAEELPVEDNSVDRVVSQFGLMFFQDRKQALEETRRVLASDGRFAIAVWDVLERSPAYLAEVQLLEELAGAAAADALRAPFVLGNENELLQIARDAGLDAQVTTIVGRADFPSIRTMLEADLRGWLPVMGVELSEEKIAEILAAGEEHLRTFRQPDGRMVFDSPAHILHGNP